MKDVIWPLLASIREMPVIADSFIQIEVNNGLLKVNVITDGITRLRIYQDVQSAPLDNYIMTSFKYGSN